MSGITNSAMDERSNAKRKLTVEDLLEHSNALLRYALTRVGDKETAEDLVQDALVTSVAKIADFSGTSTLRTWLIGILRHKVLDHYRWKQRHPGDQLHYGHPSAGEEEPWFTPLGAWRLDPNVGLDILDGDPSRELERSQLRAALQFCINHLPRSLHRVFVLRELEELEPDEVCEAAGISRDSLAVFLYRARQSLRVCLQKKWVAP